MRKIVTALLAAATCLTMSAQQRLTLQQAISQAQDSTYLAAMAEAGYQKEIWKYREFQSGLKPHLNLTLRPEYRNEAYDHEKTFVLPRDYDILSTVAELTLDQKITSLGGDLYVSSLGIWSEYFNDSFGSERLFGVSPLRIGYQHSLIGFNPHKWDMRIQEARATDAEKRYSYESYEIARRTASLYFNAVKALSLYQMYRDNAETSKLLYDIGEEKFNITFIRNDELATLKLQWMNASNMADVAEVKLQDALSMLCSFLRIPYDPELELIVPQNPERKLIDRDKVYELVRNNNPVYTGNTLKVLQSSREEEKARKEKGVQIGVDANIGLQHYATGLGPAITDQTVYSISGVTFSIPLVDQGSRKNRHNAAMYDLRAAEAQQAEDIRSLSAEVELAIRDFETYQRLLDGAQKAAELADETYKQANENYANGIADLNTFSIAQTKREDAHTNYLNVLEAYWNAYYSLSLLCVADILEI